jgi:hypothetical protein
MPLLIERNALSRLQKCPPTFLLRSQRRRKRQQHLDECAMRLSAAPPDIA